MQAAIRIPHLTPEDDLHRAAIDLVRETLTDEVLTHAPALFTREFVDRVLDMIAADARTEAMVHEARTMHGITAPKSIDEDWGRWEGAEEAVQALIGAFYTALTVSGNPSGQRYKYQGPPGSSAFCAARLAEAAEGKTYTRDEMSQIDNGFGLPASLFRGGLGCRHRWLATFR